MSALQKAVNPMLCSPGGREYCEHFLVDCANAWSWAIEDEKLGSVDCWYILPHGK